MLCQCHAVRGELPSGTRIARWLNLPRTSEARRFCGTGEAFTALHSFHRASWNPTVPGTFGPEFLNLVCGPLGI